MATGAGIWKDVHILKSHGSYSQSYHFSFFAYAVVRSKQSTVDATTVHILYSCVCVCVGVPACHVCHLLCARVNKKRDVSEIDRKIKVQ